MSTSRQGGSIGDIGEVGDFLLSRLSLAAPSISTGFVKKL
jgi:hypothetical protein